MSLAPSTSLITKCFSFHLSPLHPKLHHPRSLPFGNALYTHPVLLTLVLGGCNPAGNLQRGLHSILLNASFQHNRAAGLWTKGRQWGILDPLLSAGWLPANLSCTSPQFPGWHNAKGCLSLLLALAIRIPTLFWLIQICYGDFLPVSCVHYMDNSIPFWKITTTLVLLPRIMVGEFQKHAYLRRVMEKNHLPEDGKQ